MNALPSQLAVPAHAGDRVSWRQTLSTWWTILRIAIEERLIYRGDFWLGTLMRFLPLVTQVFLWGAVFQSPDETIGGFSFNDMVAYYLLTQIARAFSSMPGLASGIALQVRNGEIKKFLVQPIDFISFLLLSRVAHKLVYYGVAAGPYALVFFLCRGFFPGWPEPEILLAFVASLLFAFVLGFFLEATLGMIGFWFLEVNSLMLVYMLVSFFCSGHMFPIDLLPGGFRTVVMALPLQYLAYFPAAVFLGKIQGSQLIWGLTLEVAWVLFFIAASRVAFHRGVRRYSGYGG